MFIEAPALVILMEVQVTAIIIIIIITIMGVSRVIILFWHFDERRNLVVR